MDANKIEELILALENSHAEELIVSQPSGEVHIRRGAKRPAPKPAAPVEERPQARAPETPKGQSEKFITAPMVGIYHLAESDLKLGSAVLAGQAVGSIESMKIHNEVTSSATGVVVEMLVEDGTPDEYGQHLYRLAGE